MKGLAFLCFASILMVVCAHKHMPLCKYEEEDKHLQCNFVNQNQENYDFQTKSSGDVMSLKLQCSSSDFHATTATSYSKILRHFRHTLVEIEIDKCDLRDVMLNVGFQSLKRLRIVNQQNSNFFEIVTNLKSLEELSLSGNNLWSLLPFNNYLCELQNLRKLNLSQNNLSVLGLQNCKLEGLQILDLSQNKISEFEFTAAPNLKRLDLSGNLLRDLSSKTFDDLKFLKELNLENNNLSELPQELNNHDEVEVVNLQNNSLTFIPRITLRNLKILNLSRNSIEAISEGEFTDWELLNVLDLSHNLLTSIGDQDFVNLSNLKILNLGNNRIRSVAHASLKQQGLLKQLILSHNKLENLNILQGLTRLKSLSLDHNQLRVLGDNIFQDLKQLEDLSIDNNLLELVPPALASLKSLKTLDLGENAIKALSEKDFQSSANLYGLRLAGNQIGAIERLHFANTSNLHVLNLAKNQITTIKRGALDQLKNLRALRLDNNELSDINGIVSSLGNLQWLNVSFNRLQWFDYAFVPTSLELLDLRQNQIEEIGNYYKLGNDFHLKSVDLSHNKIREINSLSLLENLQRINLRFNRIEKIRENSFENKINLQFVDISHNKLRKLEEQDLFITRDQKTEFLVSQNPLECTCQISWLKEGQPRILDQDKITCTQAERAYPSLLESVPKTDLLCQYKTHCFENCLCCEFYACDCQMTCPQNCKCFHDSSFDKNIIDCSKDSLTDVPVLLPMDSSEIRLDGNNLNFIDTQSFIGRRNVRKLYLNHSKVISISEQSLRGLDNLQLLDLQNNEIKLIDNKVFANLRNLQVLDLRNNELTHIGKEVFKNLIKLTVLNLDGNFLTNLPIRSIDNLPLLKSLTLANNLWSCKCEFLNPFRKFVQKNSQLIEDSHQLSCENFTSASDFFNSTCLNETEVSLKLDDAAGGGGASGVDFLPIFVAAAIIAFVIILVCFLITCVFRAKIKKFIYNKSTEIYESRCGTSSVHSSLYNGSSQNGNNPKLFDVYISYSVRDIDFVHQRLAPTLEHGNNSSYKLCLHQRDFPPSASVYDTVSVATESSARVIIVISRSYLESEWPHVKIPLRNSLHSKSEKIILVFLEDLSEQELDLNPELQFYIKNCATVKWGSVGYLNKLRFFLPEPAFLTFQRNVTLRTLQPTLLKQDRALDQVSGVWTYSLSNKEISYNVNYNPSIMSSVYSHHTYQSIPEGQQQQQQQQQQQHIYHTLDPSLLQGEVKSGGDYVTKNVIKVDESKLDVRHSHSEGNVSPDIQHDSQISSLSGQKLICSSSNSSFDESTQKKQNAQNSDEYIV